MIEQLRGEVNYLRAAMERAQTLHLGTMGELQEMRRRELELEAQNAKLIAALPSAGPVQNTPQETIGSPQEGDRAEGDADIPPGTPEDKSEGRRWWQVWRRKAEGSKG